MADLVRLNVQKTPGSKIRRWFREHKEGLKMAGIITGYAVVQVVVVGGIAYFLGKDSGYHEGYSEGLSEGSAATVLSVIKDLAHLKLPEEAPNGVNVLIRGDELASMPLPDAAVTALEERGYDPSNAAMLLCSIKAAE